MRRLDETGQVNFIDLETTIDTPLPRQAMLERFHVTAPDGSMQSGAAAFTALWGAVAGDAALGTAGLLAAPAGDAGTRLRSLSPYSPPSAGRGAPLGRPPPGTPAMRDPRPIPRPALLLGAAGVIPFAALAVLMVIGGAGLLAPEQAERILRLYAALILSFMGGAQWGLASASARGPSARALAVSVLPALFAWAAFLVPSRPGLLALAAAFLALMLYDLWTVARGEAPAWYGRLRIGLTLAVIASLGAASLATLKV
ncbi:MAG: hypothetical protein ACI9LT_000183 [Pseudoalteromonas distincta]|jgi:hypothetical protein|tara:strand:+ start:10343 stop:11110 length:768 start_codon:yes stop_codon:yes gene_type:complete